MELLIGEIQKLGGERRRLRAKLFGAAHVLATADLIDNVPRRNIEFIERYMAAENIPVIARDLGGVQARRVHFESHTGTVFVKRVSSRALSDTRLEEARAAREAARKAPAYGEITLWDT